MFRILSGLIAVLLLAAGLPANGRALAPQEQITILVVIDGFRADYLERGLTPNLAALGARGVRGSLLPVFPSVTFPNHVTLLTGKTAEEHGIIENDFEDPVLGAFGSANPPNVRDPRFWTGAKPIWVSAEEQGVGTAHYFWPTTGMDGAGNRPARFIRFDAGVKMEDEPAELLKWLDVPMAERPRFLTLYFYHVDSIGHRDGPNSTALNEELKKVDTAIGNLVAGLDKSGLLQRTNILVTADHGMSEVAPDNRVFLDDLIDPAKLHIIAANADALIAPAPGVALEEVADKLAGKHERMTCWRKEDVPARLHFSKHPRISPIVCAAEPGWLITTRARYKRPAAPTGSHGYDPATPDMAALFVASGPSFALGRTLPPISNLEVYPLLVKLLGIRGEATGHDGAPFAPALAP